MARILVVDDDPMIRTAMGRILRGADHEVTLAESGERALELQRETPFTVIITDIFMPEMDGIELITKLLDLPGDPRIVAVSGGGRIVPGSHALIDAEALGASTTLSKPFKPAEVLDAVKRALHDG